MSEFKDRYLDSTGVKWLWDKISNLFVRKDGDKVLSDNNYTDADLKKLHAVEEGANNYSLPVASGDVLGGVRIGEGFSLDENGALKEVDFSKVADKPTTLEGYGIENAATKEELEEVKAHATSAYHYKGDVETYADLEAIENPGEGDTYNVLEYGKDYAWVPATEDKEGFWNDLGGTMKSLTNDEIDIIIGSAASEEAFEAILESGSNIDVSGDVTLTKQHMITKDTVINLNGGSLTNTAAKVALVANGAKVTIEGAGEINAKGAIGVAQNGGQIVIKNGKLDSKNVAFQATGAGSKLVFDGGKITAVEGGLMAFNGAEIEMNGGEIETTDNFAIATNGSTGKGGNTITMNGGRIVGNIESNGYEAIGVYIANNDTFVMNGGEILANGGAGLLMRAGNVTINDGSITATGEAGTTGWIGDNKTKMSKSAIIYHESANYPGKEGMSLTINGGDFLGVDHSLEILSNEEHPNVTVNGGSFTPDYPEE